MEETGKKVSKASGGKKKNQKPTFAEKVKGFCKGVKAEFKKVIWPNKEEVGKQTAAVLIISVILGAFIRVYDIVCQYIVSFIK